VVFAMSAFKGEAEVVTVEVREAAPGPKFDCDLGIGGFRNSLNFTTRDCQKTRPVSS
jgi:hypothetical protein